MNEPRFACQPLVEGETTILCCLQSAPLASSLLLAYTPTHSYIHPCCNITYVCLVIFPLIDFRDRCLSVARLLFLEPCVLFLQIHLACNQSAVTIKFVQISCIRWVITFVDALTAPIFWFSRVRIIISELVFAHGFAKSRSASTVVF